MNHAYFIQALLSSRITKGKSQLLRLSQCISSTQNLKLLLTPLSRNMAQSTHSTELLKGIKAKKQQLHCFIRKTRWQKTHKAIGHIMAKPNRETKRELRSPQLLSLSRPPSLSNWSSPSSTSYEIRGHEEEGLKSKEQGRAAYSKIVCSFFWLSSHLRSTSIRHAAYHSNWYKIVSGKQPLNNLSI